MYPPTPTHSEFGEEQDYWYDFAWELYLSAELDTISTPDYIRWAMHLDTMPGVSEYFRSLLDSAVGAGPGLEPGNQNPPLPGSFLVKVS